jgi:16S rRNA C967 or C1407 C5-methylase (RsmB/RsmF family)/NOL1/NOP2/fmu family ribosome biogenesis protein
MKRLPDKLLNSLNGIKGYDAAAFKDVHESGEQVTSIRFNPSKPIKSRHSEDHTPADLQHLYYQPKTVVPWTGSGYYLDKRPSFTFDPLFHAGCYYVQEASSMFLEQAFLQTTDTSKPLKILDLSAAPGGKSTHLQSLMPANSLLVSNDVIRSRTNILKDNIIKWGSRNVIVTNNDPKDFSRVEAYFDVIVVDAPCSGSGLFRRDPEAIDEWSENNVMLCSHRQQRILADVWPSLKEDGVLIYSTCSYSKEEDEYIMDWLMTELNAESCPLEILPEWNIVEVNSNKGAAGYRFWPDKIKGEGFFIAAFRKKESAAAGPFKIKNKPELCTQKEIVMAERWIDNKDLHFIKHQATVYAWPNELQFDFRYLLNQLRVIYSGTVVGELMRDKIVPDHALAMSSLINDSVGRVELTYEEAIKYLQRKDLQPNTTDKGWQLASYLGHSLGWMNVLPNRINNYYPQQLRILKDF